MIDSPHRTWSRVRRMAQVCACLFLAIISHTGSGIEPQRQLVFAPGRGLNIALETSGYSFVVPEGATFGTVQFTASVALRNRTRAPITFSFPTAEAAKNYFVFEIYDSAGAKLWSSAEVTTPAGTEVTSSLGPGRVWKRTAPIPLVISGVPLPSGRYTLQAGLAADDSIGARTGFVVLGSQSPPAGATGIDGSVWSSVFSYDVSTRTRTSHHQPVGNVWVTVTTATSAPTAAGAVV